MALSEAAAAGSKVVRRAVRTAGRTMSTLAKPYEAQQFEAREIQPVGDPLLRAELEMDHLQKQLQAVKVEKANLQEKVQYFLLDTHFSLAYCTRTIVVHTLVQ